MKVKFKNLGYFLWLALTLSSLGLASPLSMPVQAGAVVSAPAPTVDGKNQDKSYLEKLFGSFSSNQAQTTRPSPSALDWLLAIPATLFYGQIALLAILWILFSSSWVGAVTGLIVVGLGLAFTLPKPPRPIGLFVLAALNFMLALGITFNVAVQEAVPAVLISLVPLGGLVWWTFGLAFRQKKLP